MSFPEDLDRDRVLSEALGGITMAVKGWLSGAPTSEEPLMNRLTEQFTQRRRHCDVGVRVPVGMTAKVAFLHRKGKQQTDAYGADLAVTIEISERGFRKTVLFQIKVSEDFAALLERHQLEQALNDNRTADRSFVLVADKVRRRMRVASVREALQMIGDEKATAAVDCAKWMTVSEWLTKWLSCEVGQESKHDDLRSVENLLQTFVVEPPPDWEDPWGHGNGEGVDYPSGQLPVKAWLEMMFRRTTAKANQ